MRKFTLFLAFLPLMMAAQDRIMVIADPHVYPLTEIAKEADFDTYMAKQRKMVDLSEPIWNALMDTALAYRPSLVLIPGDLTRDGEAASHQLVSNSLQQLQQAGIRTLVIPGNHDLPGNNWESLYPGTFEHAAKDPNSHSFAVKALQGVTVIGIDGSDGNAGTGKLSEATLSWVLAQADSAVAKGHTIIAMSHWQLIEHFDQKGTLESSCRFKNADAIRDSLMAHGVHVVLTGHFHVNSISTFRDTTGLTNDSIVEISTGSPITYPCPYRWLTLSADRSEMAVTTDFLTSVDTIADLYNYSRAWMEEHTANMIPTLALRAWNKVDANWGKVEQKLTAAGVSSRIINLLHSYIPETDSARIAITQEYMGQSAIDLYLFHSEANEFEHPELADSLAQNVYAGMDGMMNEIFGIFVDFAPIIKTMAMSMAKEPVQSLVEDKTQWASPTHADVTDDLHPRLVVNAPQNFEAIEQVEEPLKPEKFIRDGHLFIRRGTLLFNANGQPVAL